MSEHYEKLLATTESLIKEYEDHPEQLPDLMAFKGQRNFRTYSPRNTMLILNQNPYATYVASYKDWQTLGYKVVKKGGIKILARGYRLMVQQGTQYGKPNMVPVISLPKEEQKVVRNKIKSGELPKIKQPGYYIGNVFDISQTDCPPEDYPKLYHMGYPSSQHALLYDTLKEYIVSKGVLVRELNLNSISLRGRYFPDTHELEINELLNDTEKLSTLTHEYGHALLHNSDTTKPTAIAECEADAVSLLIQSQLGFELTDSRKRHFMEHYKACNNIKDFSLEAMLKSVDLQYKAVQNELIPILEAAVNDMSKVPFMEAYESGIVSGSDIHTYIDYWRAHDTGKDISHFLGLSEEEYKALILHESQYDTLTLQNDIDAELRAILDYRDNYPVLMENLDEPIIPSLSALGITTEMLLTEHDDLLYSTNDLSINNDISDARLTVLCTVIDLYDTVNGLPANQQKFTYWDSDLEKVIPKEGVEIAQIIEKYNEIVPLFPDADDNNNQSLIADFDVAHYHYTLIQVYDFPDEVVDWIMDAYSEQYGSLLANKDFVRLLGNREMNPIPDNDKKYPKEALYAKAVHAFTKDAINRYVEADENKEQIKVQIAETRFRYSLVYKTQKVFGLQIIDKNEPFGEYGLSHECTSEQFNAAYQIISQSEDVTGTFPDYGAMSSMIGLYEAFHKISFDNSVTRWFGDYAMQVPKDHVTIEQFYRQYQEVIPYFPEIDLSKAERFMVTGHRLIDDAVSDESRLIAQEQFWEQYGSLTDNNDFVRLLLIRQAAADSLHEAEENLANETTTIGELDPADAVVLYAALIHMCNDDVKKHQEEHQQILNQKHLLKQAQEVYEQLVKDYDFKAYAQYRSDFDIQKYGDLINDEGFVALLSIRNYAAAELKTAEKAYNAQIADIRSNTSLPEVDAFKQQYNANISLYSGVIEICDAGIQEYSGQSEPPPLPPGEKTSTGQVKPGGKRQWIDYKEQNKINRQRVKTEISITSLASDMGYDLVQKGSVFGIKRPGERQGDGLSNDLSSVRLYPQSNTYKRHSQPDNQGSTIDFMKHFGNGESGMDFKEAMEKLEGMLIGGVSVNNLNSDAVNTPKSTVKAVEPAKKEFVLPEKTNGKFSRSFAYLAKNRCIAPEIIKTVMRNASNGKSYLYQDYRGNTVFVGKDAEGNDAFACLRSNNTDPEKTFRGDVAGSNQKVGWMVNNGADTMYVTEAPIDAMSAMTVVSELGVPLEKANYLSLCGTGKTAVFEYHMEQNPNIKNVIFACDNDSAGKEAVEKMQQIVNNKFPAVRTSIHLPKTDLNADLCMKSQPIKGMSQKTGLSQKKSSIKHRVKAVEV